MAAGLYDVWMVHTSFPRGRAHGLNGRRRSSRLTQGASTVEGIVVGMMVVCRGLISGFVEGMGGEGSTDSEAENALTGYACEVCTRGPHCLPPRATEQCVMFDGCITDIVSLV